MKDQRGAIFLEIVISIGVLALLVHAIASLIIASYDIIGLSRTRISARHLANERIELIRNLPYDQVAVAGGIPAGSLAQFEVVNLNGLDYSIRTNVVYVDDQFDGLAPNDSLPIDYKRARVDVSWNGTFASEATVTMVTDVAPKGIETMQGGGTLSILVFDASALPVAGATVKVVNGNVNPAINLEVLSDSNGRVILPGSPACFECYQIDVSKEGYSNDKTYSTLEVTNPDKPLATVADQAVTEISFAIDKVSQMTINSSLGRTGNYAVLGNQFFQLTGGKTIGTDINEQPVYKYDQLLQTDSNGNLSLDNMEWDLYSLTVAAGAWDLAGVKPLSPFVLLPDSSLTVLFASQNHADNSLLVDVKDASGSAVTEAWIKLTDGSSYSEILQTGEGAVPDFGQAFFSPIAAPGNYTLEATKSGYQPLTIPINISGNAQESLLINEQ